MKKINKNFIFGILIGLLLSTVTVYAANTYLASNIKYKNTNVEDALNELYSSNCINGSFEHISNTQINYKFKFVPSKLIATFNLSGGKVIIFYSKEYDGTLRSISTYNPSIISESGIFIENDTIKSEISNTYITYKEQYNVNYTICK